MMATVSWAQSSRLNESTGQREELRFLVGGYGALSINLHSAPFGALPGIPSCCPEFKDASSLSPSFGALLEVPLMSSLRGQIRLGYTSIGGNLTIGEVIGNEPVLDDGPAPTQARRDVTVEHFLGAPLPMIALEPTVGWRALDVIWLNFGVRAGYLIGKNMEQKETLLLPEGYTFIDGTAVRNEYAGPIPEANALQLHAVFALGYELTTRSNLSIVPEVRYYLPLTAVSSVDWRVQSFQIGVSVRYGVYTPIDPVIIRDTVYKRDTVVAQTPGIQQDRITLKSSSTDESTRREGDVEYQTTTITEEYLRETPKPFVATVKVVALARDKNGILQPLDSIRIEELDVIESYPLLPQIFFAEGSAELTGTTQARLQGNEANTFKIADLTRDQLDVYRNLLNTVGDRMRKNPATELNIVGCTNNSGIEQSNKELSKARAEAVKQYLVTNFGIAASRLNVSTRQLPSSPANPTTADGKQENQRVELSSNDLALFEPVEFRDRDLKVTPAEVILRSTVTNGDDVSAHSASVAQRTNEMLSVDGSGLPTDISWRTDNDASRPRLDASVVAKVSVRNAQGLSSEGSVTMPVDYATLKLIKSRQEEGKLIERYSLIVFEYNSAQLNASNQRLMNKIKERIQPDSRVTITGYADRQGMSDYNRELARRRCVEAQRVLGLKDSQVTLEPIGSDRLIFNNDLPEGRSYSRTVQIEIQTPIR